MWEHILKVKSNPFYVSQTVDLRQWGQKRPAQKWDNTFLRPPQSFRCDVTSPHGHPNSRLLGMMTCDGITSFFNFVRSGSQWHSSQSNDCIDMTDVAQHMQQTWENMTSRVVTSTHSVIHCRIRETVCLTKQETFFQFQLFSNLLKAHSAACVSPHIPCTKCHGQSFSNSLTSKCLVQDAEEDRMIRTAVGVCKRHSENMRREC